MNLLRSSSLYFALGLLSLIAAAHAASAQGVEHYSGDMIHAEYDGRAPERPGSREIGSGQNRGGDGGNKGGPKSSGPTVVSTRPAERKTTVTINGETFNVSVTTEERLADFLKTYRNNGKVGAVVAAVASIFSLFDLFDIDKSFPGVDAKFKLGTFDSEEVVMSLSAVSIWNRAFRAEAAAFCEQEMAAALFMNRTQDAKMWLRIRDIIANPERYQGGGIKYDAGTKKALLRSYPAEAHRSIAGFSERLSDFDIQQLGMLTNYLMYFPKSRDYILYADYIYNLRTPSTTFVPLTYRDQLFLNEALLVLSAESKNYLDRAFAWNSVHPSQTHSFWSALRKYLTQESWSKGIAMDSTEDALGFDDNVLPNTSDLVTGAYPTGGLLTSPVQGWNIPAQTRHVYTFYYPGG